ncbi:hypothetical protein PPMP20_25320 [Paraburkholderia phymatum]|uniref:hypothetical protein n=1 Tax=Paraburkholderia phymatum TaxID=148447 RepID=UPI0012FDC75B|nr:hypothetical protein [Paraburkholderia phymatum]
MRDEMPGEQENRAVSTRGLNASICNADDLQAPLEAPPGGVQRCFHGRRTLAKTNAGGASGDADRIYSMPDMAKMLFSMLYQALQRVILRNPYPDWVCAALS